MPTVAVNAPKTPLVPVPVISGSESRASVIELVSEVSARIGPTRGAAFRGASVEFCRETCRVRQRTS
jgi:hypothetical protein